MKTTAKSKSTRKPAASSKSGQFLGRSKDGILIVRPDFKPKSFTVEQLQKAIREVRKREADSKAG